MAVTDIGNSNLVISNVPLGIQVTKVTDTSADWSSVPNSTYFYDKGDALVHYKNSSGAIVELFSEGTVSSVGLTMPSAFTVSNSPITSSGDIAVTGAGLSSQYVRGDGALANFPTNGGGGSSVNFYLNGSINQGTFGGVTYYELSKTPIFGAGTNFIRTNAQGNGYIASFITDAGEPNLLNIPSGNWNIEFYFNASSGGGSPNFYNELYKVSNTNVFTLIASSSTNPEAITQGTTVDQYFSSIPVPQTTLLATDRIAIRVFVNTSGRNITLHTEDNNLSEVITTFSTGLNALNGLTAQVQYFGVGSSGTDFNISSVIDTHTFNLPTASATNTGKLSSGDWTTFNGKQNPISLTTTGSSGASTLIGNVLNIPQYSGGSGLSFFTEAQSTASPNNIVNVDSLTAVASTTNADFVIRPKNAGAILSQIPDGTLTGGDKRGGNAIDFQKLRAVATQVASGSRSVIINGANNTASSSYSTVINGENNTAFNTYDIVVTGLNNTASGYTGYSTVVNGRSNSASNYYGFATILSGCFNTASGYQFPTILNGCFNTASGTYSSIVNGILNIASSSYTSILNGCFNTASGFFSIVSGSCNIASCYYNSILNGRNNTASSYYTSILNGTFNNVCNFYSTILNGTNNTASGFHSSISSGTYNNSTNCFSTVSNGYCNTSSGCFSSIISGRRNTSSGYMSSTVSGAYNNSTNCFSTVLNGSCNTASGVRSSIVNGGCNNATNSYSTVSNGYCNTASAIYSSILNGKCNTASAIYSTVLNGKCNTASGCYSTASGGYASTQSITGRISHASGKFSVNGDSQISTFVLRVATANNVATTLTADGSTASATNQIVLANQTGYRFRGTIIGKQSGSTNVASWDIDGLIVRGANAGTTTVNVSNVNVVQNTPAWGTPTLSADTVNGGLQVQVTGASTNIRWTSVIETTEIIYA